MRRAVSGILAGVLFALTAACSGNAVDSTKSGTDQVQVWLTTADKSKLLSQEESVKLAAGEQGGEGKIVIDANTRYQQMDGFGASMTDSSAYLIGSTLSEEQRETLMNKLFDHEQGIGISYMRIPLGASDFARSQYSYDDMPAGGSDPSLAHFSIDHDKEFLIPALKQAMAVNPELKLMGSPWSAPGWMKTSDSMIGGSLKPEAYGPYADYFIKTIQAFEAEGVPMDAVTPQNEPHYVPDNYPGMRMEPYEQADWIKNHLGPAFEKNGMRTKIVIWDHNWDEPYYPMTVLNDPEAKKYIAGTAFHGYAGEVSSQSQVHDLHPDKSLYFTESTGGAWATEFGGNLKWDMHNLIIGATRNWAKVVLKWNMALDENYGPTIGGCQDCTGIVTINQQTGDVTYNAEYYSFGHASKFVRSGAYRIESGPSDSEGIEQVAFRNPDGSIVLVAMNSTGEERELRASIGEKSFSYKLPAGAAATFILPADAGKKRPGG